MRRPARTSLVAGVALACGLAVVALAAFLARPVGAAGGLSVTIPVTPPTDHLRLTAPAAATAGTAFGLVVVAQDRSNAIAPGFQDTVHFTSSDSRAILPADYTFTLGTGGDNGTHAFVVTLETAGLQIISATDTANPSISGVAGVLVSPAATNHFVLGAPAGVMQGSAFDLTVAAEDRFGNIANGYRGTAHFSSSDPRAVLPADHPFTATDGGVHAFLAPFGVTLRTAGVQTVVAIDTAIPSITGMALIDVSVVPLSVTSTAVLASEGALFTGTVATFTDPVFTDSPASYAATIDWGDGTTPSGGTITLNGGTFLVNGIHTYTEESVFPVTVTIADGDGSPGTTRSLALVADQPVIATPATVFANEGASAGTQAVATFTDPAGPEALGDYSATIGWGDTKGSAGTITFAAGVYTVSGAHTYAEEGAFAVTVTIQHDTATPVTVNGTASVADPSVVATGGFTLVASEGTVSSVRPVATFTDPGGPEPVTDYVATITWGDTSSSAGIIMVDGDGVYTVTGAHQYAEEGVAAITVSVAHESATPTIASSSATVGDPGVLVTPAPVSGVEGLDTGTVTVATFTDPGGSEPVADYVAAISWRDGSSSAGTITFDGIGVYTVAGHNLYKEESSYTIGVTVTHEGAPAAMAQPVATVADAQLTATAGAPITPTVGTPTATLTLATFTDANPYAAIADFTATVDWGDGRSSAGTVSGVASGGFAVSGSHTFASVGRNTVIVIIRDDGGSTATVSLAMTVNGIVIALDPTAEGALSLSGKAVLTTAYGVVVNSNSREALEAGGRARLAASSVNVTGGVRISGGATVTPAPATGVPPTPDPYASLAAPSVAGQVPLGNALHITTSTTLQPGLYTGGIQVSGMATVTLAPGTYVIQGGDLQVSGPATVSGQNVWLVFEASPTTLACGGVELEGRASLNLSAPTSGNGLGVSIYIDRACSGEGGGNGNSGNGNGIELSGQAALTAAGAIVVPTREVDVDGRARLKASAIDADTIGAAGQAAVDVP